MACLAVPGMWTDRDQLMRQLAAAERKFALLSDTIIRARDLRLFECDLIEHDPALAEAFRKSGLGKIPEDDLKRIAQHSMTLYIRSRGGSHEHARAVMDAGTAAIHAGGLGVKMESSLSAFGREQWLALADSANPAALYRAFVSLVHSHELGAYSCGMHNFGLPDAITNIILEPDKLAALVHNFLGFVFNMNPELEDADEVGDPSGLVLRIRRERCTTYLPQSLLYNPYGFWRLEVKE